MGFDLYGLKPKDNEKPDTPDFLNDEEGAKAYFSWQENTDGAYFRNNVWWWRPLWNFICMVCDDILTNKDMELGNENSGHIISKTKAKRIAGRISRMDKNMEIKEYETNHKKFLESLDDEDCNICDGTGKRKKAPEVGAGDIECNGCNGRGTRKHFSTNYPFDADNIRDFAKFCRNSGGFEIC
mgnify:CR=1 FL=1